MKQGVTKLVLKSTVENWQYILVCLVHLIFTLNAEWSQGRGALGVRGVES